MLHEDLVWCFEAEAFSGSVVETVHSEGDVLGHDGVETHFLREELADQAVHVLVGATLPGGIGMSEEEVGIKFLGNSFVLSELLAIIGRQGMDAAGKGLEQADHGIGDRLRVLDADVGYQAIAGLAFVEGDQGLLLARADHQIALRVAEAFSALHDDRTLLDGDLIGDGAAPFANAIALPARLLAAQGEMQGAAHAFVGIDALIDALVADGGFPACFEVTADLLGAPQLAKPGIGKSPSPGTNARAVLTLTHTQT